MLQKLISRADALFSAVKLIATERRSKKSAPAEFDLLRAVLTDFSEGNARTIEIGLAALQGSMPEDSIFSDEENPSVFKALAAALEATGWLVALDWKEPLDETTGAFADLFLAAGLDPDPALTKLSTLQEPEDGQAVPVAYPEFRRRADAAGWRILSLNGGSDMYLFTLVPEAIAGKWQSVEISQGCYLEDADWKFLPQLQAAGLTPRSTHHPQHDKRRPS